MINGFDEFWICSIANEYIKLMSHIKVKNSNASKYYMTKRQDIMEIRWSQILVSLLRDRYGKSLCMYIFIKIGRSRNVVKNFMGLERYCG
jgi:hypothetical protein